MRNNENTDEYINKMENTGNGRGRYRIITLGCRVNRYESEHYAETLEKAGFEKSSPDGEADIIILNTCAVTGESDKKSRSMMSRIRRYADGAERRTGRRPVTAVTGCHVQELSGSDTDGFDVVCGNENKDKVALRCIEAFEKSERVRTLDVTDMRYASRYAEMAVSRSDLVKAFVKIEDGCNGFCSYCLVPFVRGRSRSRNEDDIISEVRKLAAGGFSEIVFTGIEVGDYNAGDPMALVKLAEKAGRVPGIKRIRFGSINPRLVTEEFIRGFSETESVMPHFHLSLQSGSDRILSAMRRTYGEKDEERCAELIYKYYPDACISADMICGFPGESEEDFQKSCEKIKSMMLLHTHIFPYSARKGTRAASMSGQIPASEKKRRCAEMEKCAENAAKTRLETLVNREYTVLCEVCENGKLFGHTENFIYTCAGEGTENGIGKYVKVSV